MTYEPRKAAQLIAYLIDKSGERSMKLLKVIKLVYLTDRESVSRNGFPVLDELRFCLPHGPINSTTLNCLDGDFSSESDEAEWNSYLSDRADNDIGLRRERLCRNDLDELSDEDLACADLVWAKFGHMTVWQLRNWTHEHLPEWQDPNGGRLPISMLAMMRAIGLKNAEELARQNENHQAVDLAFDMARAL